MMIVEAGKKNKMNIQLEKIAKWPNIADFKNNQVVNRNWTLIK